MDRTPKMPAPGLDGPTTVDTSPPLLDERTRRVGGAAPKVDDATRVDRKAPKSRGPASTGPKSAPPPSVGSILAETYVLVRLLGEGGMGRVYEARHTRITSKRFAVKMLHAERTRSPEALARFQREAEAAALIRSVHAADVYDIGRAPDGSPFIVAELVEGRDLGTVLKEHGRFHVTLATQIVMQLCDALEAAHRQGVIHRDLKPDNVILLGDVANPVAKVIDFGLSKVVDAEQALTQTGMIMGTPSYMPPEQARGEHVDHRADLYSLGAIFYELVTGTKPFNKPDAVATIAAVLIEQPPPPRALVPDVPEVVERVILKAMSKRADARFGSAKELSAALAGHSAPQSPPPVSPPAVGTTTDTHAAVTLPRYDLDKGRMQLAAFAAVAALAILAISTNMVLALVRTSRGSNGKVTAGEAVTVFFGIAFALSGPAAFGVRHVARSIWGDARQIGIAAGWIRAGTFALLIAYGSAALVVRLVDPLFAKSGAGIVWPVWEMLIGAVALGAGGVGVVRALGRGRGF
ncbi:MAG: serine/threonine protein kinase [Polyangiaceae bacterium]|nr:serine/threonine protein kinase [Polyangiaceae bacterium]